jgi:hypothetical protein
VLFHRDIGTACDTEGGLHPPRYRICDAEEASL